MGDQCCLLDINNNIMSEISAIQFYTEPKQEQLNSVQLLTK